MESFRSLINKVGKAIVPTSDEEVFVQELEELLRPHVKTALDELNEDFRSQILDGDEKLRYLHQILLRRFFAFAKKDPGLGKFMFPIMMYLRKARRERLKEGAK